MKLKATLLLCLIAITFNVVSNETNHDYAQSFKDIELASQLGSGQEVIIDLTATEGLEGKIAQSVRDAIPEEPKPLTFFEWLKSFFSFLF